MATAEQLTAAVAAMAAEIAKLTTAVAEQPKAQGAGGGGEWDTVEKFKNLKHFSGESKDWEEFSTKLRSQVGPGCRKMAQSLYWVETQTSQADLEKDDWTEMIPDNEITQETVNETGTYTQLTLPTIHTGETQVVGGLVTKKTIEEHQSQL